jgi:acyl-CoA reductase-like NAD-dependent aldehyde dehydrogenase
MTENYRESVARARRRGQAAHDAMDAWLSRPLDEPGAPGDVLEAYAKELRESREELRRLLSEQGVRDDIEAALKENEAFHRSLGLSMRDLPDPPDADDDALA